eukprot:TRINITY_DN13262_c0_g3_i1.p1 TRINITY_DN13262_c0_g3~~TRINITY_DN13262_c0_g3_i1.p1  ORF type:complete len:183 (+),score=42.07 TRINITY_DN13262_c0_g3_i1:244-792(+)
MVSCAYFFATIVGALMVGFGITGAFTAQFKQKDGGDSHLYLYQSCNSGSGKCEMYDKPASDQCDRQVYDRFITAFALSVVGSILGVAVVVVSLVGTCKRVPGLAGILIDMLCAACFIIAFCIVINLYKVEFCPNTAGKTTEFSKNYEFDMGFPFLVVAAFLALICILLHAVTCGPSHHKSYA